MPTYNQINHKIFLGEDYILVWVEAFLKAKKSENITRGSLEFYQKKLKAFTDFLETQEVKFISQITPSIIRDFLLILEDRGHNSGGIHGHFRSVRAFMKWYWEEEEMDGINPISKVKAPKVPQEAIEGVSREEFNSLLEECRSGFYGERNKTILKVLYDTGVRANELCSIKLVNLDLIQNSILIEQGKGRKPRFVFFGKSTKKQIKKYLSIKGESKYLFTSMGGDKLNYAALREIVRGLAIRAGIRGVGLHDFRRAFCLNLLQSGVPEITIARLMGHTTTQLIGRYAKQTTVDIGNMYKSPLDE